MLKARTKIIISISFILILITIAILSWFFNEFFSRITFFLTFIPIISLIISIIGIVPVKESVQSVLNDNFNKYNIKLILSATETRAFRTSGPHIIDFEEGNWVYVPEITKELIELVHKGKILMLGGKPATGKSVIVRYIGYNAFKEQKNTVYYFDFINLDFREKSDILNKLDDISNKFLDENYKTDKKTPIMIFENVHDPELNDRDLGKKRLYHSLKALEGKIKICITTREKLTRLDWVEKEYKINLDEELSLNHEIFDGILDLFNSKRVKDDKPIIEWGKSEEPENLWLIAWNLRWINELKIEDFNFKDFKNLKKIRKNIEAYYDAVFSKHKSQRELIRIIILVISVFSRFEIYLEEEFILQRIKYYFQNIPNLNLNSEKLKKVLILLSESKEIEQKLSYGKNSSISTFSYRISHIKLAEFLYDNFSTNEMKGRLEKVFERYFKDGKKLLDLGYNLWLQKKPEFAFRCFKFTKTIETAIRLFIRNGFCEFRISENQIVELYLEGNNLIKIPVEIELFQNLDSLIIRDNEIEEVQYLESLSELKNLDLSDNKIAEIKGLSMLIKLEVLDLGINKIKEIKSLVHLKNLKSLGLSHNKIKEIKGLDKLIHLEKLFIANNKIKEISGLEKLKNLKVLDIEEAKIKEIKGLEKCFNLEELSIRDNKIEEIKGLDNLRNLKKLNLTNNKIGEIKGTKYLFSLTELLLSFNYITKVKNLENNNNLQILALSNNCIKSIEGLNYLTKIKELDLSSNDIREVKVLKHYRQMEELDLGDNDLHKIKTLKHLKNLRILDLSFNSIKHIRYFNKLVKLDKLFLGSNKITSIKPLRHLHHLHTLSLTSNPVKNIKHVKSLKYLKVLGPPDLKMIKGIEGFLNITDLILEQKELTTSDTEILKKLPALRGVILHDNSHTDKIREPIINVSGHEIEIYYF